MTTALRPLSTGELLDRTFSLYRSHFALFVGIVALPHLIILAFQCMAIAFQPTTREGFSAVAVFGAMFWGLGAGALSLVVSSTSQPPRSSRFPTFILTAPQASWTPFRG